MSTLQGGLMMDKCRHGNEKYKCNLCVIRGEVETIHGWREIAKESPTRTGIYIAYKYPDDYNGEMYSCELWSEKHGGWCEAETEFDLWLELPDPPMSTIQGGIKMGTITVDGIMNLGLCDGYTRERMEELRKTQCGRRKNITMKDILTSAVPPEDRLWLVLRNEFLTDKELHEIAIWCWEKIARPIWEKHYPGDKRPHKAVRIKKLWLKGNATDDELGAARAAAGAKICRHILKKYC